MSVAAIAIVILPSSRGRLPRHTPEGVRLAKGDVVRLITATGGGSGDPRDRPREKVLDDLKNGYITSDQAMRHYGVEQSGAAE